VYVGRNLGSILRRLGWALVMMLDGEQGAPGWAAPLVGLLLVVAGAAWLAGALPGLLGGGR
jgi:hypothetical protein